MPREWKSPIEAKAKGSLCNFQLEIEISIPIPAIPSIKLPQFPPKLPSINLVCPFDSEEEITLE